MTTLPDNVTMNPLSPLADSPPTQSKEWTLGPPLPTYGLEAPAEEPYHGDGHWLQTATGKQFWPLSPRPEDVCLSDLARGLAFKCRFAGQTKTFYSVAQHSVLVSQAVLPHAALWGLLHDAAEAWTFDAPRPIKKHLIGYAQIEERLLYAVAKRFGMSMPIPKSVKHVDNVLLVTERRDVMTGSLPWPSLAGVEPLREKIIPVGPEAAEQMFLARFAELY